MVGQAAKVARAELASDLGERQADAIAIGQRRRWVNLNLRQRKVGVGEQMVQAGGLCEKLLAVGEVLKLASSAEAEVLAGGVARSGSAYGCDGMLIGIA